MRIDVIKAALKKGDMVMREGFPDIPDDWRELRRGAMARNLTCVRDYIRQDLTVKEMAWNYRVSASMIRSRVKDGVKFLKDHDWLYHQQSGQEQPDSSSSEGRKLSSG